MIKKTIFYKRKQAFLNESLNSGDQQCHQYHKKRPRYITLEIQSHNNVAGDKPVNEIPSYSLIIIVLPRALECGYCYLSGIVEEI
jgi:hypothetical protein